MNDADLRQRLDALTYRMPAQPDAYELVRTRAGRIRRRRSSAVVAGLVVVVAAAVAVPETLRHQATSPAPSAGATLKLCTSHDLVGVLRGVGLADGLPQGAIEISTTSSAGCTLRGNLQMDPLTSTGAVLPVPAGGLPGPTHGVYAPLVVKGVLAPASAAPSSSDGQVGQVLDVTVGDDAGGACAAKDRQTRPASFRVTIGAAVVVVENRAAATDSGAKSLVGCPGRFYAGGVILQ